MKDFLAREKLKVEISSYVNHPILRGHMLTKDDAIAGLELQFGSYVFDQDIVIENKVHRFVSDDRILTNRNVLIEPSDFEYQTILWCPVPVYSFGSVVIRLIVCLLLLLLPYPGQCVFVYIACSCYHYMRFLGYWPVKKLIFFLIVVEWLEIKCFVGQWPLLYVIDVILLVSVICRNVYRRFVIDPGRLYWYVPHLATSLWHEYEDGVSEEVLKSTIRMRLRRMCSIPIPDRYLAHFELGTSVFAKYLIRESPFFMLRALDS